MNELDQTTPFLVSEIGSTTPQSFTYTDLLSAFNLNQIHPTSLIFRPDLTGANWIPLQSIQPLAVALNTPYVSLPPITLDTTSHDWYYMDRNRTAIGPQSLTTLLSLYSSSTLTDATLVWHGGMEEWKRLSAVKEIEDELSKREGEKQEKLERGETLEEHKEQKNPILDDDEFDDGDSNEEDEDEESKENDQNVQQKRKRDQIKKKKKEEETSSINTSIYVTGLPHNLSVDEAHIFFKKAGIIKEDPLTLSKRIKLYPHPTKPDQIKGDGVITYVKPESVTLAIQLLDGAEIKPAYPVTVKEAEWSNSIQLLTSDQRTSSSIPIKRKKTKLEQTIERETAAQALSWEDEDPNKTNLSMRIVTLKHMFTQEELSTKDDPDLFFEELTSDIGEELEVKCGSIEKMTLYERHQEGIVVIKFHKGESAMKCVALMNKRYFAGREIECTWFNGEDYSHKETEEEEKKRLEAFGEAIENGEI